MKKIIALLLSILMVCSLAACASKQDTAAATETAHRDGCKQQRREDAYHGDERCLPAV